jgi:hypothetical protein
MGKDARGDVQMQIDDVEDRRIVQWIKLLPSYAKAERKFSRLNMHICIDVENWSFSCPT